MLAAELRRRRTEVGWSQSELANRVGYSREYVSRAERASKGLPSAELIRVVDAALRADGALTSLHDSAHRARLERRHHSGTEAGDVAVTAQHGAATVSTAPRDASARTPAVGSIEVPATERVHELFVRAQSMLSSNDRITIDAAVSLLDRALEIEPQFARARAARGYAAWRQYFSGWDQSDATLDAALQDVGTALSRDPTSIGARTTLIRICWDMGWHERAIEIGKQVHEEQPDSFDAALAFARALHNGGLANLALPLTRQVLAVDPTHPTALKLMIWSLVMTGCHSEAIQSARPYLSTAPRDSNTRWAIALAHLANGDPAEATRIAQEAVDADPHDVTVRALEGYLLRAAGDDDAAHAAWLSAIRFTTAGAADARDRMNLRSQLWMASIQACVGQEERARSCVADALARGPHNGYIAYRAAHVLAELGDCDAAVRALDDAVAAGFLSAQLLRHDERLALRGLIDHPGYRHVVSTLLTNVEQVRSRYGPHTADRSSGG
jgi:tetratricopeptide (TPR) repeat protein/transcriptional regulator with XRE-family HTH domain